MISESIIKKPLKTLWIITIIIIIILFFVFNFLIINYKTEILSNVTFQQTIKRNKVVWGKQ